MRSEHVPIGECEICGRLGDHESSFVKIGHEEETQSLPDEASRLVEISPYARRCPVCGTYYDYETTYEFLIGGSEDEEHLDRMTPTEARRFYSAEEYAGLIEAMEADVGDASPKTREYAARSLAAHYLLRQEVASVERLLRDPDVAVAGGALQYLHRERYRDGATARAPEWEPLVPALEALHRHEDDAISLLAGAVLYRLGKIERRAIRRT